MKLNYLPPMLTHDASELAEVRSRIDGHAKQLIPAAEELYLRAIVRETSSSAAEALVMEAQEVLAEMLDDAAKIDTHAVSSVVTSLAGVLRKTSEDGFIDHNLNDSDRELAKRGGAD